MAGLIKEDYTLDKTDLRIIGQLARDSRLSYERIGSALNLTRNSIKTRIKRMVSKGVIQEYFTDINYAVFGYRIYYIFTRLEEKSTKNSSNRRKMIIEHLNRLGNIIAEIEILGEISIFRVAVRETNNDDDITRKNNEDHANSLLLKTGLIEKAILASNTGSFQTDAHSRRHQTYLSPTDLKIIRCLVLDTQIGLANIARSASVSTRTGNRILNKLKDEGVVRFSVICNPAAMKGLVVFGLLIYVNDDNGGNVITERYGSKKSSSHKVLERLYTEFPEYPFLRSPLLSHDNIVIFSVFGNDVFAIDSMFKKILSFQEVRNAELYVFTTIKYHKDWIVREIDRKLESKL